MKSQVLHTVWCNISGEAAGEIWTWSLLGVEGLMHFRVSMPPDPRGYECTLVSRPLTRRTPRSLILVTIACLQILTHSPPLPCIHTTWLAFKVEWRRVDELSSAHPRLTRAIILHFLSYIVTDKLTEISARQPTPAFWWNHHDSRVSVRPKSCYGTVKSITLNCTNWFRC